MPATDLDLLTGAAHAAGEIALRHWQKNPRVWDKPGEAGPVTEADLAVNDLLFDQLRAARPKYGWLSEETEDSEARLDVSHTLIIDPIDGTRAFIAGEKSFAHSLAVARNGEVTAAVVHMPAMGLTFAATEGQAATLNGQPISVSAVTDPHGATVLTGKANLAPERWRGLPPPVKRVFRPSLAYRLCLVAQGRFDAMISLNPIWEWDIAAGDLIARQAGAMVTDPAGKPLRYNAPGAATPGAVAASPGLHRALLGGLAG